MRARNSCTYLRFYLAVKLRGCARPRSSPLTQGSGRCAPSCAPTGEPTLSGAPLSPCFAAESTREGTLMSLPEGAPARSSSGAESSYPKYTLGKRGHPRTVSQRGKAVSSVVTSGCPKRSEGGFPVGTRTITAFPSGTAHSTRKQKLNVKPPSRKPGGLPYSRFRRRILPRCRSPPQPSAHEYAAPYPAPLPPGTRPRGESPWGQRRGRYRRTAP